MYECDFGGHAYLAKGPRPPLDRCTSLDALYLIVNCLMYKNVKAFLLTSRLPSARRHIRPGLGLRCQIWLILVLIETIFFQKRLVVFFFLGFRFFFIIIIFFFFGLGLGGLCLRWLAGSVLAWVLLAIVSCIIVASITNVSAPSLW